MREVGADADAGSAAGAGSLTPISAPPLQLTTTETHDCGQFVLSSLELKEKATGFTHSINHFWCDSPLSPAPLPFPLPRVFAFSHPNLPSPAPGTRHGPTTACRMTLPLSLSLCAQCASPRSTRRRPLWSTAAPALAAPVSKRSRAFPPHTLVPSPFWRLAPFESIVQLLGHLPPCVPAG